VNTDKLCNAELYILTLFYQDKPLDDIAEELHLSNEQLEVVTDRIKRKTGAKNWMDLLHLGRQITEGKRESSPFKFMQRYMEITQEEPLFTEEEQASLEYLQAAWQNRSDR